MSDYSVERVLRDAGWTPEAVEDFIVDAMIEDSKLGGPALRAEEERAAREGKCISDP